MYANVNYALILIQKLRSEKNVHHLGQANIATTLRGRLVSR